MLRDRTIFFRRSFPRDKRSARFALWSQNDSENAEVAFCIQNFLFYRRSSSLTFNSTTLKFILLILAYRVFIGVFRRHHFSCKHRVQFTYTHTRSIVKSFYNSFPFHNDKLTWCTHNAHSQLHSIKLNNWIKTDWLIVSLRVRKLG